MKTLTTKDDALRLAQPNTIANFEAIPEQISEPQQDLRGFFDFDKFVASYIPPLD